MYMYYRALKLFLCYIDLSLHLNNTGQIHFVTRGACVLQEEHFVKHS